MIKSGEWKLLYLVVAVNFQYSQNEFLVTMWSTRVEYTVAGNIEGCQNTQLIQQMPDGLLCGQGKPD